MESFKIAAVSMNSPFDELDWVFDQMDSYCHQAAEADARLIVFPELLIHSHCNPKTWELAEAVPEGPSVQRCVELAKKYGLVLSVGISEKPRDIVFNTQFLVGPSGYIGKQRKIHLSRDETLYYKGGREIEVHDLGFCKVGTIICYDNQFPEVARILALKGADVLLMPHAARIKMWGDTPESAAAARQHSIDFFTSCYAMRARENACFAVLANMAGRAGHLDTYPAGSPAHPHHCGGGIVFAPDGEVLSSTQRDEIRDEMIICELDPSRLAAERSLPNYTLRTRRPELYDELVRLSDDA
ncbi:MAG: carbon-nitrogen hydrolase family protein [Planctomycetales bacterium]